MFLCFDWQQCLGASGTPQAVTNILVKQSINDAIRLDYLKNLRARCIECAHIDALQIEGLEESRRIIFPSGLAILIALFEKLSINNMQIAGGALREGIIYGMLDNFQRTDRRTQGIESLSERFHIDRKHARRVRLMSIKLIRQLCGQSDFCDLDTESIVATAASLHEVGLHIGYKNHNEHGAYILTHTDLTGFTQLQRTFIRDLVGMHRQEIDLEVLNSYEDDMRQMLENGLRVLRIAIILCTRRKDEHIPQPDLIIDSEGCWSLKFAKGMLSAHPIVQAELIQETWLQHKVGWSLRCV
jgi:exopolyphosphatase/guanosine-5'-triphosphate,3'-diphosphate pyrophosphatase